MKKFLIFILLSVFTLSSYAKVEGDDILDLSGKVILDEELFTWMKSMESENVDTLLEPRLDLYRLDFKDHGVRLDYTVNFHLKEIHLYDSGSRFARFDGQLPMGLNFDMDIEDVLASNASYTQLESNPFEIVGKYDNGDIVVNMRDGAIEGVTVKVDYIYVRRQQQKQMPSWKFRLFSDGNCLTDDCLEGKGTMDYGDGAVKYTGDWAHGMPNGQGVYIDSFKNAYKGAFMMGFFWGQGILEEPGAYRYVGEFMMSTKTGYGEIDYKNGFRYEGQWLNNAFHGKGTYYQHKGVVYTGTFREGQYYGYGKLSTPGGYFEGYFKNGKPHGEGVQYSKANDYYLEGEWIDGKKEGEFIYRAANGGETTLYFENDQQVQN